MGKISSVSAMAVLDLYDQLLQLGVVSAAQLQVAGFVREALVDVSAAAPAPQEQRLAETRLLGLWQLAVSNPRVAHIGLLLGQRINPDTRGVLASWLFQCARADEAFAIFVKHIALMNPAEHWTASAGEGHLELRFSFAPGTCYPQAASERSMSALLHWHRALTGVHVTPLACEFAFAEPSYVDHFVEVFGRNLRFARPANRLEMPSTFLQHPIRGASPYLKQLLEQRALQTYAQLQRDTLLVAKVRSLIQANLHSGANIQLICQLLHVTRPTLYRRLKQDGVSFTELLEAARKELAQQHLQQGHSQAVISDALGFKDVSSLHRAFKRWFGPAH